MKYKFVKWKDEFCPQYQWLSMYVVDPCWPRTVKEVMALIKRATNPKKK